MRRPVRGAARWRRSTAAVMTEVPAASRVLSPASSAPQVLAPAIAAPLVTRLGGYPTLYLSVAAITVLGSIFVLRIRSVP
jgi:hypothetical protein